MLAAGTAEAEHEAGESSAHERLDMRIKDSVDMIEEAEYSTVFFEKSYDRLVPSGLILILDMSAGIVKGPAVKDISSAVP